MGALRVCIVGAYCDCCIVASESQELRGPVVQPLRCSHCYQATAAQFWCRVVEWSYHYRLRVHGPRRQLGRPDSVRRSRRPGAVSTPSAPRRGSESRHCVRHCGCSVCYCTVTGRLGHSVSRTIPWWPLQPLRHGDDDHGGHGAT